jgi:hypothetical protein
LRYNVLKVLACLVIAIAFISTDRTSQNNDQNNDKENYEYEVVPKGEKCGFIVGLCI